MMPPFHAFTLPPPRHDDTLTPAICHYAYALHISMPLCLMLSRVIAAAAFAAYFAVTTPCCRLLRHAACLLMLCCHATHTRRYEDSRCRHDYFHVAANIKDAAMLRRRHMRVVPPSLPINARSAAQSVRRAKYCCPRALLTYHIRERFTRHARPAARCADSVIQTHSSAILR